MTYSSSQALNSNILGSKEWRSGESARLPPMWPGFKSRRRRHMWVEFVVGLLREVFLRILRFSPLLKNISKFQFDYESGRRRTTWWMCYLQIVIYLFVLFNSANWANHVLSQSTALLFLLFFSIFYHFFSICLFLFLLFLFFLFFPFIRSKWQIYIMIKITDGSLPVELSSWPIKAKANGT